MAASGDVNISDAEVFALINDPAGPVGRYLLELSEEAAAIARTVVRVRGPGDTTWSRKSSAKPPGYTKAGIRTDMYTDAAGYLYGGVAAPYVPAIFLEYPAKQMHREYPFLTTAVETLEARA